MKKAFKYIAIGFMAALLVAFCIYVAINVMLGVAEILGYMYRGAFIDEWPYGGESPLLWYNAIFFTFSSFALPCVVFWWTKKRFNNFHHIRHLMWFILGEVIFLALAFISWAGVAGA